MISEWNHRMRPDVNIYCIFIVLKYCKLTTFLILRLLLLLLLYLFIADVEICSKIWPQHHGFQYRSHNYSLQLVRWSYYNSSNNFWKPSDHNAPVSTHYSVKFLQLIYQQNIYATQKYELTYQTTFWKIPTSRSIKILRAQKRCQVTRTTDFLILNYSILSLHQYH